MSTPTVNTTDPNVEKPLISVCCTTHNMVGIVEMALESILSQKGNFYIEIIIHDDASTDGTREILQRYQENYPEIIHLILQEENQHAGKNISLGEIYFRYIIPRTHGSYIAICDGDDYWTDEYKLQKQLSFLGSDDSYAGCFTNALILNEIDSFNHPFRTDLEEGAISDFKIFIGGGGLYPSSTLFLRKDALVKSDMYRNIMDYTSDLEWDTAFIFALSTCGRIGYIDAVTSIYRRWPGGKFSSIKDNAKKLTMYKEHQIKGLQKLFDLIRPHQRPFLKRKISVESYFVLQHGNSLSRYRHLKNLHYKEWGKWILRMKYI